MTIEEPLTVSETAPGGFLAWLDRQSQNLRLTRFMLLRFTGLVWFAAWLSAALQFIPLVGHDGLLPADLFVKQALARHESPWDLFWEVPSIFWFHCSDTMILTVTWTGVILSLVVLCGYANAIIMFVLWALYMSLLPIGQEWLSYGWDIQILETGFLGMMLCPLLDPRPFSRKAPPVLIIWLYRWLIIRIMLGAGLIKWRGDTCWRDLTALFYHYETQPVPNPFSPLLHAMPKGFHQLGVVWNHFVELIVPWFSFVGRWPRHIAGLLMSSFMVILIFSGNLSFLNWLTLIPCLACFDDSFWRRVLPQVMVCRADRAAEGSPRTSICHWVTSCIYAGVVAWLSWGPVKNLISSEQAMNTSFDRLHLVNTYGAFGTVDRERFELVFQGTDSAVADLMADWKDYEFKAKPTDPKRRPVMISPYHYRLDWAAWYPWHRIQGRNQWVPNFIWKLLHNDPVALGLIANNPFPSKPPQYIRVLVYRYKFAPWSHSDGTWWVREREGTHIYPLSKDSPQLQQIVRDAGWMRD
jgi:hypothetical protein